MQIIYDGVGADPSGVHTPERFLEIMNRPKKWQKHPETNFANWIYENEIQGLGPTGRLLLFQSRGLGGIFRRDDC